MKYFFLMILLLILPAVALSETQPAKSKVYVIKTSDRTQGIKTLLKEFKLPDLKGKKVIIKPNFNIGADKKISKGRVFDQEQIKRAAELAIGAKSPEEIEFVPLNSEAQEITKEIKKNML